MTLLWHLAKKDIRAARLPVLLWIALSVFDVFWQLQAAPTRMEAHLMSQAESFLRTLLPLAGVAAVLLIVSTVVHADPIPEPNAFWLTRPIPPRRLFLSKLLALATLILGPPILAETLMLVWFRVPVLTMAHVGFEVGFAFVIPVILLFVLAAITPDFRRYMLLIASLFGAALLGSLVMRAFPIFWMADAVTPEPRYADATRPLVVTVLMCTSLALILRRYYVRRDWHIAVASTVLAIAGVLVIMRLWPPEWSLFGTERAPDAAWAQPDVTRLRRDGDRLRVTLAGVRQSHVVATPLVLDGLPEGHTAAPFTLRGELTFADGTVVRGGRATFMQMGATARYRPSLTLAYGPMPLASGPMAWEGWPVLVQIPSSVLGDHLGEAARYAGTFRYRLARHEPLATLPIQVGETHVDGSRRLTIRDVDTKLSPCRVALEIAEPAFMLHGPREPALGFHFVDRRTGARLRAIHEWTSSVRGMTTTFGSALSGVARAFSVRAVRVWVEDLTTREAPEATTARTCAETQLVVVRTTPEGALTRSIEIPDLRIASPDQATRTRSR